MRPGRYLDQRPGGAVLGAVPDPCPEPGPRESARRILDAMFGAPFVDAELRPYLEKIDGVPLTRIPGVRPLRLMREQAAPDGFWFPRWGIGQLMEVMAEAIRRHGGAVLTGTRVAAVEAPGARVRAVALTRGGRQTRLPTGQLVVSAPPGAIVRRLEPLPAPAAIPAVAMRAVCIVYLEIARPDVTGQAWIQVDDPRVPAARIFEMPNWSRAMCPADRSVLGMECYCTPSEHDPVWSSPDADLSAALRGGPGRSARVARPPGPGPPRRDRSATDGLPGARPGATGRGEHRSGPARGRRRAAPRPRVGGHRRHPRRRGMCRGSPGGGALISLDMGTVITPSAIDQFRAIVGPERVLSEQLERLVYAKDGSMNQGECGLAVLCGSTAEVAACVRLAAQLGLPIVPRGSGTSLAGSAIPLDGAVVISVARMDRILVGRPRHPVRVGRAGGPEPRSDRGRGPPGPALCPRPLEPGGMLDRRQRRHERRRPALPGLRGHGPARARRRDRDARRRGPGDRRPGPGSARIRPARVHRRRRGHARDRHQDLRAPHAQSPRRADPADRLHLADGGRQPRCGTSSPRASFRPPWR